MNPGGGGRGSLANWPMRLIMRCLSFFCGKAKRKGKKGSDLSTTSDDQALPALKADMLPNEIEELTES